MGGRKGRRGRSRRVVWARRLVKITVVGLVAIVLLWVAIHRISWLGPALANGARAILGPGPVAWMEDVAYGIQDRINRWRYRDARPTAFWQAPQDDGSMTARAAASEEGGFFPPPFAPPHPDLATEADGIWVPVEDKIHPDAPVVMYKSLVHPDRRRSYSVLAVIAIDPEAFDLRLMAGTSEPESNVVPIAERPGRVPAEHYDRLVAAFNGGFRATHGQYGMMLDGKQYLPPRGFACTFVRYRDDQLRIGTWTDLESSAGEMLYYRQSPPCLVEAGETNKVLRYNEYAKGWGATVSGDTVIRRSAIGLDQNRKTLFYGLGESMTAQCIAGGMRAAGAHWVAELDVNHSYPRFLFYERPFPTSPPRVASALIPTIEYMKNQYVGVASGRDFFYLLRKPPSAAGVRAERDSVQVNRND